MKKNVLYWCCQILGWGIHALFNVVSVLSLYSWNSLSYEPFLIFIISFFFSVFFSHLYRFYIIKNKWVDFGYFKLLPKVLGASVFLALINFIFSYLNIYLLNISNSRDEFTLLDFFFTGFIGIVGLVIIHFGWSLIYFSYHYIERKNQLLKDEATLKDFELNKLKSQLNPHFIFNALNSIRALVEEEPEKCKEAINHLSNILRGALIMDRQKLIPFAEELKAVKDYLALETIRFEERLNSEFKIDPNTYYYKVPPLMIQTLIENGIKHGISKLKEGGIIELETEVKGEGDLIIKIRNSGKFNVNGDSNSGHGIANTQKRLKLLYGGNATFKIGNETEGIVLTELLIPYEKL